MVTIRKLDAADDPWNRWRQPRATYAVVVGATDGGASVLSFPDLEGHEMLVMWTMLPPSVLPLAVGDVLLLTMQRLTGQLGGWTMWWSSSKGSAES